MSLLVTTQHPSNSILWRECLRKAFERIAVERTNSCGGGGGGGGSGDRKQEPEQMRLLPCCYEACGGDACYFLETARNPHS